MPQHAYLFVIATVVLGVAGIIVWHFQGRNRPTGRLLAQIICFLGMSLTIHLADVVPFRFEAPHFDENSALVVSAKILWWTHLSWATIGFVRIYIVLDRRPREARLVQDLLVAIVYLGVFLSILAFVFGAPIATLLATSGVVAIILGLALQNTLGDVFSGVALTLGRTYAIGDWILLGDGSEGRVIASNWRSTYLLTSANNVVVLPNSVLAKQSLTNVSKPDETHQIVLPVNIVPNRSPHLILAVMQEVVNGSNTIVHNPPPIVSLVGINGAAIEIQLLFQVRSPSQRVSARNEVVDLVYRHCVANDISLSLPPATQAVLEAPPKKDVRPVSSLLGSTTELSRLKPEERDRLLASAVLKSYEAGEKLTNRFAVIRTGVVEVRGADDENIRLAPGDTIGALEPQDQCSRNTDARAITRATVYEIDPASIFAESSEDPGVSAAS
ncbi:mechanosensitive ion channel family protein [Neorhizobium sp. CSC1952]|uniref:mechanosensitive ion channel family protein n=1 Tax=Neorhizobium sp. CSC1952 TaxID=2978974 RepID=UPI0025A61117|nr:mechanosensitive ion channel family protein [Rhizobium sp. CSC1952]WJR66360.1 mechanosensitive ion channel family protein [Rhizobium sp. CSC1952]